MGKFSFDIPAENSPVWVKAIEGAWLSNGYDHWPVPSELSSENGKLILRRKENESATLDLIFLEESDGARVVSTSTLRPNAEPYHLTIELARGTINRLRNAISKFASAGFAIPRDLETRVRDCTVKLGRAVTSHTAAEKDILGIGVISDALRVTDSITDHFAEVRLNSRLVSLGRLPTLFGCCIKENLSPDETAVYCDIFNAVRLVPEWRFIEPAESQFRWSRLDPLVDWAKTNNLAVSIGPIIDFSAGAIPQWLLAGQGDIPTLAAFMADCVGNIVDRYRDHVHSWQLFSGLNCFDQFGLGEDDRLRLAARLLESCREIESQASWSYSLQQPYGDYLRDEQNTYSPLVFSDTLLRSGHEVSAISLNIASDLPRDSLDLLQLLDNIETIFPKLEIVLGGFGARDGTAFELSLLRTALSCKSVGTVYWQDWSELQTPSAPRRSLLYDLHENRPTALLCEFQSMRSSWLN